jgi:ABC-type uncharacterized transport system substrate-binding protein
MMRKTLFFIFGILLITAPASGKEEITIILSREIIPYEAAVSGFKKHLAGFHFNELALDERTSHNHLASKLQENPPSLILAVGPEAACLLHESSISSPRAFTMVLNPRKLLPDPLPFPGVSMNYSPSLVLSMIKKGFEDRSRIGIFFSPTTNAPLIEQYQALAWQLGLEVRSYPISTSSEVRSTLKAPEFDPEILLFVPDRVVIKEKLITYIIEECLFRKIPAVGFNTWFAKSGAILSLHLDYEMVGEQTAAMASTFINNSSVTPWVEPPQELKVIVNAKVARKFGIAVSDTIVTEADHIIK